MVAILGLTESMRFLVFLMLSFSFFIGIVLMVSHEAFAHLNQAFQKEYGLKKRLLPKLENIRVSFIDWIVLKYRFIAGLLISVLSFLLLLLYK